tara:strand:- start:1929 stop:2123 length:195 start_codon:yes stop_codon:yes gene_type:complete
MDTPNDLMEEAFIIFDKDNLNKTDIERLLEIQEDLGILTNDENISLKFGEMISLAMMNRNVYNP